MQIQIYFSWFINSLAINLFIQQYIENKVIESYMFFMYLWTRNISITER